MVSLVMVLTATRRWQCLVTVGTEVKPGFAVFLLWSLNHYITFSYILAGVSELNRKYKQKSDYMPEIQF